MRILELFAGYGSQALALENLGIDFTSDISEIDKYAIQAYNQLHGETHNWGDINKIDERELPYYDLITYSSPCQDFSTAGKQKGGDKGSGTRSSLLWECERIIRAVKPKYLLMENVKNLLSDKHRHNFNEWFKVLEGMGYTNYYKVLNAKDYGIPQNRERIFCVSILGGGQYLFPNPIPLEKRLKDVLEDNVDEKYYLSDKIIKFYIENTIKQKEKGNGFSFQPNDGNGIAKAITTRASGRMDDNFINEPLAYDEQNGYIRQDGCVGTLTTDGSSPKHNNRVIEPLQIKEATQKGYADDQPNSKTRRGRVGKQISNTLTCSCNMGVVEPKVIQVGQIYPDSGKQQAGRIYDDNGISPAMDTCQGGNRMPKILEKFRVDDYDPFLDELEDEEYDGLLSLERRIDPEEIGYRIRKLTARECWRLMGVKDEQFDRLYGISNSQLYKLAGNSIVVDVLEAIFKNLLMPETTDTKGQLNLF